MAQYLWRAEDQSLGAPSGLTNRWGGALSEWEIIDAGGERVLRFSATAGNVIRALSVDAVDEPTTGIVRVRVKFRVNIASPINQRLLGAVGNGSGASSGTATGRGGEAFRGAGIQRQRVWSYSNGTFGASDFSSTHWPNDEWCIAHLRLDLESRHLSFGSWDASEETDGTMTPIAISGSGALDGGFAGITMFSGSTGHTIDVAWIAVSTDDDPTLDGGDPPPPAPYVLRPAWRLYRGEKGTSLDVVGITDTTAELRYSLDQGLDMTAAEWIGTYADSEAWVFDAQADKSRLYAVNRIAASGAETFHSTGRMGGGDENVAGIPVGGEQSDPGDISILEVAPLPHVREVHRGDADDFEPSAETLVAQFPPDVARIAVVRVPDTWYRVLTYTEEGVSVTPAQPAVAAD